MTDSMHENIQMLENHLKELDQQRSELQQKLNDAYREYQKATVQHSVKDDKAFSPEEKITIFMNLFRGRLDVFPKRWDNPKTKKSGYSPACFNEWVSGKCNKPRIKCSECPNQAFIPLTNEIIRKHLSGDTSMGRKREYTIGIYPILSDDTCWFLAIDFDKEEWQRDVSAFLNTCRQKKVPFALERSRSGNGAHIWIFFDTPIAASHARKMGSALLTETMDRYPEIGFNSYDRFFPNQDTLPSGGFGNLIALPLQHFPRQQHNSVFLDENFSPYPDQWKFLASVSRMSENMINDIVEEASDKNKIMGVRLSIEEDGGEPWKTNPSRKNSNTPTDYVVLEPITITLSNQIFIEKQNLPPSLISKLIRLAAFQNPEFYKAQSMRLSTFGKPRIIACAEAFSHHIGLPRGCFDDLIGLLNALNIKYSVHDERLRGTPITFNFLGELTDEQQNVIKRLAQYDTGTLSAPTAFGKTVIGAHMIHKRKTNTLIIVHRKQLLDQWTERLKVFLGLQAHQIGIIGGGKDKPSGIIDIAMIQSLIKGNVVNDRVAEYGHVIVDECHHVSAVNFEAVVKECKAKYVLGLTATPIRKDGHHPIIFMQCGPILYTVDAKEQAHLRPFNHTVIIKNTSFDYATTEQKSSINEAYSAIMNDQQRNMLIVQDVVSALKSGRSPLILTERKEHVLLLNHSLTEFCNTIIVMTGGQNAKKRAEVKAQLENTSEHEERLLIATGRYLGEGFDDKRLDTLFLTMPISWHGTLFQYAGRLHRACANKKDVIIYDYVDYKIPMLKKMADKRMKGYAKMGYSITS